MRYPRHQRKQQSTIIHQVVFIFPSYLHGILTTVFSKEFSLFHHIETLIYINCLKKVIHKILIYLIPDAEHELQYRSKGPVIYESTTLRPVRQKNPELEAESNLFRCMSDASLVKRRRGRGKSAAQREKERQHRFSINGHFYNYKVPKLSVHYIYLTL